MKIGVYVGSFNPVHKGHIKIVNTILENDIVDKVFIIPTKNYWDKQDIISIQDRENMLRIYETSRIIINTEYNDLEYTYQIINALKDKFNDTEFSLIIGADNIVNFDKWNHYKDLLELNLIIIGRNDIDIKYYLDKLNKKDRYTILDIADIDISSTLVRNNIGNNKELAKYLDQEVIDYIEKNKLYRM